MSEKQKRKCLRHRGMCLNKKGKTTKKAPAASGVKHQRNNMVKKRTCYIQNMWKMTDRPIRTRRSQPNTVEGPHSQKQQNGSASILPLLRMPNMCECNQTPKQVCSRISQQTHCTFADGCEHFSPAFVGSTVCTACRRSPCAVERYETWTKKWHDSLLRHTHSFSLRSRKCDSQ